MVTTLFLGDTTNDAAPCVASKGIDTPELRSLGRQLGIPDTSGYPLDPRAERRPRGTSGAR